MLPIEQIASAAYLAALTAEVLMRMRRERGRDSERVPYKELTG